MKKHIILVTLFLTAAAFWICFSSKNELPSPSVNQSEEINSTNNTADKGLLLKDELPIEKYVILQKNDSDENEDAEDSPDGIMYDAGVPVPTGDELKAAYERSIKRTLLISNQFTKNEEWNSVFMTDEYSEWGVGMNTKFQDIVHNNKKWEGRAAKLESVECKTKFCKVSFYFDEDVPIENRNAIHFDFFPQDEPSLHYATFYDEESETQNIYIERCTSCD